MRLRAGLLICASVFLCGIGPAGAASPPLPVSIGLQTAPDWLVVTAEQQHLFEKAGLKPTYMRFTAGAPMMAAAESGSLDVTVPGTVPFTAGLAQGVPWVAIGIDVFNPMAEGIVVRKGAGIHSLADLKGKRIGYFRASTSHYGLAKALEKGHIALGSVTLMSMAPAIQVAAMRAGQIDATEVWEPWMQKLVHQANGRVLVMEGQYGVDTAGGFITVRRDWLATHRETARRLMQALIMAYDLMEKNPTPAIAAFAKDAGIDPAWSRLILKEAPPSDPHRWMDPDYDSSVAPNGRLHQALNGLAKFLYQQHVTARLADTDGAFDDSVIASVLAERGHAAASTGAVAKTQSETNR